MNKTNPTHRVDAIESVEAKLIAIVTGGTPNSAEVDRLSRCLQALAMVDLANTARVVAYGAKPAVEAVPDPADDNAS